MGTLRGAMAGMALLGCTLPAAAVMIRFDNVDTMANDYASQLSVEVESSVGGHVSLTFLNDGPVSGRIKGISIQDLGGHLDTPILQAATAAVGFKTGGGAHLPASLPFVEDYDFTVDGRAALGVDPGESLQITFDADLSDILADLEAKRILFGLHVGSIGVGGDSQKFVSRRPEISEAGRVAVPDGGRVLVMLGAGVVAIVLTTRRSTHVVRG